MNERLLCQGQDSDPFVHGDFMLASTDCLICFRRLYDDLMSEEDLVLSSQRGKNR